MSFTLLREGHVTITLRLKVTRTGWSTTTKNFMDFIQII